MREVLEYVCPQLSVGCLRLGHATSQTEEALLRLDELGVHKKFKVSENFVSLGIRGGYPFMFDMYFFFIDFRLENKRSDAFNKF